MGSIKTLLLSAIFALFRFEAEAAALSCGQIFHTQNSSKARFENLEKKFATHFNVVVDLKNRTENGLEYKIRLKHGTNEYSVGHVQFTYYPLEHRIDILSMNVMTEFKRSGIGEVLIDQVLQRFETEIISVSSLASDNHAVMLGHINSGLSLKEAVKLTPAYKIREKLGFTEIIPDSINSDFGFSVRRPK